MDYPAVSYSVNRFKKILEKDKKLLKMLVEMNDFIDNKQISNVKT